MRPIILSAFLLAAAPAHDWQFVAYGAGGIYARDVTRHFTTWQKCMAWGKTEGMRQVMTRYPGLFEIPTCEPWQDEKSSDPPHSAPIHSAPTHREPDQEI